ncbi:MAG TPA: DUF302 domain-containing protein [Candidatus Deferrimicrobium sp.]|nr:DUF302 domain-containing protein [Candidatus Deferrimicrobium sp.]
MEPIYSIETNRTFDETVKAIEEQTLAQGFRVLHIHDVQATLADKNFEIEPLKIVEVCNAKYAYSALNINITISLLMPCRINVHTAEGKTVISTFRPTALSNLFGDSDLSTFAQDVEEVLLDIINNSK